MTIVVGFNWLSEMVMIADTRVSWKTKVSWPGTSRPPQEVVVASEDILQKLYSIHSRRNPNKAAVLGFSSDDIDAARTMIVHLGKHKFQNYNRPLVMANLKDDLRQWMEEVAMTELTPEARIKLKFMLCGIEPSRHPPVKRNNKVIGLLPIPEAHLYLYTIRKNGKVEVSKNRSFAVIGSGQELARGIQAKVHQTIRFGFDTPKLHWARAMVISEIIASICKGSPRVSASVGGPFQVVRITPNGLITTYNWPLNEESNDVEVREEGTRTVIYNPKLEKRYTLYPIWELHFQ